MNTPTNSSAPVESLDLEALDHLCKAATPGPWIATPNDRVLWPDSPEDPNGLEIASTFWPNAEFIAAARTALPMLLADKMRGEVKQSSAPDASDLEQMKRALTFAVRLLRAELGPGGLVKDEPEPVKATWKSAIECLESVDRFPMIPLYLWRNPEIVIIDDPHK